MVFKKKLPEEVEQIPKNPEKPEEIPSIPNQSQNENLIRQIQALISISTGEAQILQLNQINENLISLNKTFKDFIRAFCISNDIEVENE